MLGCEVARLRIVFDLAGFSVRRARERGERREEHGSAVCSGGHGHHNQTFLKFGNFVTGLIASFADRYPLYRLFMIDFLLPAAGAIALAMLIRPLRKLSAAA